MPTKNPDGSLPDLLHLDCGAGDPRPDAVSDTSLAPPPSPSFFPRRPGETPRAFDAFLAYFQLGQARSLQGVADRLGEKLETVKKWSSRHGWADRLHAFSAGLLQRELADEAAIHCQEAAGWARRRREFREQEWLAGQQLLAAARCFLESFGDRECERMTLAQVSRAIQISANISRQALHGDQRPDEPGLSPIQAELTAALEKAYGLPPAASSEKGNLPLASNNPQPPT